MNLNISFTDLMKKFSKKRGGSKPAKSAKVFSPESVWKNILISFTIVNVLVVAWSAYLFFFVKPADDSSASTSASADTSPSADITAASVAGIVASYDLKANQTNLLLEQKPEISDPS
jgi:hypothetical protein